MSKKNKKKDKKKRRDEQPAVSADKEKASAPKDKASGLKEKASALDLRSVKLPAAPKPLKPAEIRALRTSMNASQALFARLLNVSSNAVESWEQGLREPRQATLKLLHVVRKSPNALLD
jgi:putative transcriptional regulator